MQSDLLLSGISLNKPHFQDILEKRPGLAWVEIHSETFFNDSGHYLRQLESIRNDYPISLHGSGMSLGASDELNWQQLKTLKDLSQRIDACLISDHLSWSSLNGQYFHDLFPLSYSHEALDHIVTKVKQSQDFLQRQILLENIPHYLKLHSNHISEHEFLNLLVEQTGCGIVLDINALYVSANNLGFNPQEYLAGMPANAVQELHVSGFSSTNINGDEVLLASKNRAILPAIWDLYKSAVTTLGHKATIVEWQDNLPAIDTLCLEAFRAETMMREIHATSKLTG